MLNNHLTSIQNVSKIVFISLLFLSCSSSKGTKKEIKTAKSAGANSASCSNDYLDADMRFLTKSAMYRSQKLKSCFKNYMRFESNKNQTIYTCNVLTVNKHGNVSYVYTRGYKGTIIPKDLKMCMEQEFWKMHLKGLQLTRGYTIKFPLSFKSN